MISLPKPAQRQSMAGVRLRKHAGYQRAYAASRKRQSASMSWFLAPQPQSPAAGDELVRVKPAASTPATSAPASPRIGLTAGKVLGKAHERNRIKRRMREALRRHIDLLPEGFDLILHPRRAVLTMDFAKLEAEIVHILEQARVQAQCLEAQRSEAHPPASAAPLPPGVRRVAGTPAS
jgi:ribonuclease P protein component